MSNFITDEAEAKLNEQLEKICSIFTKEDQEFNSRMVQKGRIAQGKNIIPSITEKRPCYTSTENVENDDYDFTSKPLKQF